MHSWEPAVTVLRRVRPALPLPITYIRDSGLCVRLDVIEKCPSIANVLCIAMTRGAVLGMERVKRRENRAKPLMMKRRGREGGKRIGRGL